MPRSFPRAFSQTLATAFALVVLSAGSAGVAHAHVGVSERSGLTQGLAHPLSGLDHLAAMLAVGLWASQLGARATWGVPLAFLGVMSVGAVLGATGVALPLVEPGIAASVLVLGLLVAAAVRMPFAASAVVVGLFALAHGHAHGTELPATASGLGYSLGFLAATAALSFAGVGLGIAAEGRGAPMLIRGAGAAIAVCGLILCVG